MKNEHKFIQEITIHLKENKLIAGSQLEKFKELIKVNGSLVSVKEQISKIKGINWRQRFDDVFSRFKKILKVLKH